jgi:molybdopterin/thiamine biosynthesis adenylyltransferase
LIVQKARYGDVLRALAQKGFTPRRSRGDRRAFEGVLKIAAGKVPIRMEVGDWEFLDYPTIRLLQRPSFLPDLLPHVTTGGDFCYLRPESLVLDRYDPAGALLRCLEQAEKVLEDMSGKAQRRVEDIQDEFQAYWLSGQNVVSHVLLGTVDRGARQAHYFNLRSSDRRLRMISSSEDEVQQLANAIGYPEVSKSSGSCRLLRTTVYPAAPEKMPETIKELFHYLKLWDPQLYKNVQDILEHDKTYLEYRAIAFAVDTPAGWIGFGFGFDELPRLGYGKKPVRYKQYLHKRGGQRKIFRIVIDDVSPQFIHSRNLLYPDLTDKRITLVGCGAIGGYLAKALASVGAGRGVRGQLTIYDGGTLGAENVGRHYLGMNSLNRPKAEAVAEDLRRHFPDIRIEAVNARVPLHENLFLTDLVIDATGKEPVAEMLNAYRLAVGRAVAPFLYLCIRGNGEAVQGLWTDTRKYGCFRCLRMPPGPRYLEDRYKLLNQPPNQGFKGCQAFTPYAVSAPMSAAALATDMIVDWLEGDVSPRFRTRTIEVADVNRVKSQDIEPIDGCPACGPH